MFKNCFILILSAFLFNSNNVYSQTNPEREWNIYLFFNMTDSGIASDQLIQLVNLEKAITPLIDEKINFLVQYTDDNNATYRFKLKPSSSIMHALSSPKELLTHKSEGWRELFEFYSWGNTNYKSVHDAFIFNGHGNIFSGAQSGLFNFNYNENNAYYPNLTSDEIRKKLIASRVNIHHLKMFLNKIKLLNRKNLDIMAFDACLLGSIELQAQTYNLVEYIIASPNIIPNSGLDYAEGLKNIDSNFDFTSRNMQNLFLNMRAKSDDTSSGEMYLYPWYSYELNQLPQLMTSIDEFTTTLMSLNKDKQIELVKYIKNKNNKCLVETEFRIFFGDVKIKSYLLNKLIPCLDPINNLIPDLNTSYLKLFQSFEIYSELNNVKPKQKGDFDHSGIYFSFDEKLYKEHAETLKGINISTFSKFDELMNLFSE